MTKILQTDEACELFKSIKGKARGALRSLNELRFPDFQKKIHEIKNAIDSAKESDERQEEAMLNDFYVLYRYTDFLIAYSDLWEKLLRHEFSNSWNSLQSALDLLRLIKRFSKVNIEFFESQLIELEKTYPYNVFFSVGATVEKFECSICALDIDSEDCPHIRGELYGGKMACAIARDIIDMNHVSMVSNPEDKRCVVKYEDNGEQFKLVRYLADFISQGNFNISDFGELKFSKKKQLNPEYKKLGRNDCCYCGSGKKFKKCCIPKEYIDNDHIDIVFSPKSIEEAVA